MKSLSSSAHNVDIHSHITHRKHDFHRQQDNLMIFDKIVM